MEWVLLIPAGVEVTIVRDSDAVDTPTLLTAEQIVALTDLAASMVKAGLPVDVGELIRRSSVQAPRPMDPLDAQYVTIDIDNPPQTPSQPVSDPYRWQCVCGDTYREELTLRRHQRDCGDHQRGVLIPPEFRMDS